ncbi:sensor domain-containing protein [Salirhabdus salicampi]|uniref:sensor domain-containing protein n=1 Tax=Salirhabdus salicampi TaxID=476102 RepID=UPI0020C31688|nr:EAL domain-containing protein [Salirhabdus salicampi]MCP8617892.1 EAL domain-containing protein [Salirhabdus salicampi]
MKYIGRLIMLGVASISVFGWTSYDFFYHGLFSPTEILLKGVYFPFAWWAGYQFDKAKFLNKKVIEKQNELQDTFESMTSAFLSLDKNWRLTYANSNALKLLEKNANDIIGKIIWDEFPEAVGSTFHINYYKALNDQVEVHFEEYYEPLEAWFEVRAFPTKYGLSVYFHDVTSRVEWQRKVDKLAKHDILTGLPNRYYLTEYLEEILNAKNHEDHVTTLLFIDLDRFKAINDSLGHHVGDVYLEKTADRIRKLVPSNGFASRYGGDEFVIVLKQTSKTDTEEFVKEVIDYLNQPVIVQGQQLYTTPSIGISVYPQDGNSTKELLQKADQAMYAVKKQGKNNFLFYSPNFMLSSSRKMLIESELRKAIEHGDLSVHYQPQYKIGNHTIVGMEALVRWEHETLGFIPPSEFIPITEEIGYIHKLGKFVFKESCKQLQHWHTQGFNDISLSVNVSTIQFKDRNFMNDIREILTETNVDPQYVQIEITESALHNYEQTEQVLQQLNELGVKVSVDDFGTGYSSLSVLQQLTIHRLKIDKSFIDGIHAKNHRSKAIVKTIIDMGHHLNLELIAEGVENAEQLAYLQQNQCEYVQGYYFSKPLSAYEINVLLEKHNTFHQSV